MFERLKVGLALGAGGARGLAHIGVLKALERAGVAISFIAGSSTGALIGGLYAHTRNSADLEKLAMEFPETDLFKKLGLAGLREVFHEPPESLPLRLLTFLKRTYIQSLMVTRVAVLDDNLLRAALERFIPDVNIEDLSLPFGAVSNDLRSGRPVLFRHGPLRDAVLASMAIPGIIAPVKINDLLLTDGGVLNSVPVQPLHIMGADVILAVDVEMGREIDKDEEYKRGVEILFRAEDMESYILKETQLIGANLTLKPEVGHIHWSDFSRAAEIIKLGYDEAVAHLNQITRLAGSRKYFSNPKKDSAKLAFDWLEI